MNKVVCISTSPWKPIPTSKQEIMSRLDNTEVLYFDPPVTYIAPLKDKNASAKLQAYKAVGDKVAENITVYSLPPVLPFFNKLRFINKLNQRRLAKYINKKMREHGFDSPTLWVYTHTAIDILPCIEFDSLVYHCVDRHSAFKGLISPKLVDDMDGELAAEADFVFCTSQGLHDWLSGFTDRLELVPNGANYELFSSVRREDFPVPADMAQISEPIFGFFGALQECIEYDWVEYAAVSHPTWNFIFVGPQIAGADLSGISDLPNVHLLGLKKQSELPAYLSHTNVCLNLFKAGNLSKSVSPLKLYEYLVTGKPIVSTPQPDQVWDFSDVVIIASSEQDFTAKLESALWPDYERLSRQLEYAETVSWDSRAERITEVLRERGIFEQAR